MDITNIKFNHSLPIQIRFNDIDALGHVNNAVLSAYYDLGRIHYFQDIQKKRMDWNDPKLVIVNLELNFYSSIRVHDEVFVETKIYEFGNKSVKMIQRIIDKNNVTKSTCRTILSGYDIKNDTSMVIPNDMKQIVNEYENNKK